MRWEGGKQEEVVTVAELNERQRKFVDEYLVDMNATQAAIRAGYSPKTAYSQGQRLLKNAEIKAQVDKRVADRVQRTQITQDFVLNELMKIAMADGTDFASIGKRNRVTLTPTAELPPEKRAAVAAVKKGRDGVEIKTYDKLKALELLGRHLGLFDAPKRNEADQASLQKLDALLEGISDAAKS